MKIVTVVGARPQFVKAAAVSRELRSATTEILVHTGQHYDYEMSGIFFDGLDTAAADVNLGVGSGSHGAQTGAMLKGIEDVLSPSVRTALLIYGDTNSTLAGASPPRSCPCQSRMSRRACAASTGACRRRSTASSPIICRTCCCARATRRSATWPPKASSRNVHLVGDVMLDVLNWARERRRQQPPAVLDRLGVEHGRSCWRPCIAARTPTTARVWLRFWRRSTRSTNRGLSGPSRAPQGHRGIAPGS